ncbi:MAG TPA: hypothetical protein VN374_05735, partial [Desulfitobacteriaceae bacterium]|nr:hypothetical protein [Desulfitobacteriaceae bacterium]
GYRRGLITGLAQIVGIIIGFLVASMEYLSVMPWLKQFLPLQTWLESLVYKLVLPSFQNQAGAVTQQGLDKFLEALPTDVKHYLAASNMLGGQPAATLTQSYLENIAHSIATYISDKILALLAFILVLFVVAIIITALINILFVPLKIFRGPVKRVGGIIFGGLSAFLILAILSGLLLPVIELNTQSSGLLLLQRSFFLPYLLQTFQLLRELFYLQLGQDLQTTFSFLQS